MAVVFETLPTIVLAIAKPKRYEGGSSLPSPYPNENTAYYSKSPCYEQEIANKFAARVGNSCSQSPEIVDGRYVLGEAIACPMLVKFFTKNLSWVRENILGNFACQIPIGTDFARNIVFFQLQSGYGTKMLS